MHFIPVEYPIAIKMNELKIAYLRNRIRFEYENLTWFGQKITNYSRFDISELPIDLYTLRTRAEPTLSSLIYALQKEGLSNHLKFGIDTYGNTFIIYSDFYGDYIIGIAIQRGYRAIGVKVKERKQ